jgi:hypothetical protein
MEILSRLRTDELHLILAPRRVEREMVKALIVSLSLSRHVRVLDGGNSFDGRGIARALRGRHLQPESALARISLARAFTCYQMGALLEAVPAVSSPTIVLELLTTFYDESVALHERQRVLQGCLLRLGELRRLAPVVVSAALPGADQPVELLESLEAAADQIWHFESPSTRPPLRLF